MVVTIIVIRHHSIDVLMARQLLHLANVAISGIKSSSDGTVSNPMGRHFLRYTRFNAQAIDDSINPITS